MSLKLKVFDEAKSIYAGFKECFLDKVTIIKDKILKELKEFKDDQSVPDNSIFSQCEFGENDNKAFSG